jgi:hypothetical protein
VNDLLHNTTNVTIALGIIEWTEFCRRLIVVGVRFELVAGELYIRNVSANEVRRTIACERLCVRITLPIVNSRRWAG